MHLRRAASVHAGVEKSTSEIVAKLDAGTPVADAGDIEMAADKTERVLLSEPVVGWVDLTDLKQDTSKRAVPFGEALPDQKRVRAEEDALSYTITITGAQVGLIIGKGGANISLMRRVSGANINVNGSGGSGGRGSGGGEPPPRTTLRCETSQPLKERGSFLCRVTPPLLHECFRIGAQRRRNQIDQNAEQGLSETRSTVPWCLDPLTLP